MSKESNEVFYKNIWEKQKLKNNCWEKFQLKSVVVIIAGKPLQEYKMVHQFKEVKK